MSEGASNQAKPAQPAQPEQPKKLSKWKASVKRVGGWVVRWFCRYGMPMALWDNPIYRLESRGRGPKGWLDWRGWLLGRGGLMIGWRVLPVLTVAGCVALSAMVALSPFVQAVAQFGLWASVLFVSALVVLGETAMATGRDWQEGKMEEWVMTPIERSALVAGKVWGWALPMGAALTVGWIGGQVVRWLGGWVGWGVPLFVTMEWWLMLVEAWAALFLMASVGVWTGSEVRRVWMALAVALAIGVPLLAAMLTGIAFSFDRALLGGHLLVIGGSWLVGSFFHGLSERRLRWGAVDGQWSMVNG